jgi:hypothetical protein
MARFKFFPHNRRPGLGELLGISQAERQVSRKHHLRIVRDPMSPLISVQRAARRRSRQDSFPTMVARFLRRVFR